MGFRGRSVSPEGGSPFSLSFSKYQQCPLPKYHGVGDAVQGGGGGGWTLSKKHTHKCKLATVVSVADKKYSVL